MVGLEALGAAAGSTPPENPYCGVIASEVSSSSSYPARDSGLASAEGGGVDEAWRRSRGGGGDDEADLELGLSLGAARGPRRECCRILTARDFPSMVASRGSPISSSSSSASSSPSPRGGDGGGKRGTGSGVGVAGTKRAADPVSPSEIGCRSPGQVVGWPPIRAFRMNTLANQSKDHLDDDHGINGLHEKASGQSAKLHGNGDKEDAAVKEQEKRRLSGGSRFVKVNMDGVPIGRKVDLGAHRAYETLALALEDMFQKPTSISNLIRSAKSSKLLDGSSEFVLTYEDKDGDWLLAGDVPWGMFLSTVKRLRIMRTSDANGLAPRCQASRVGLRN